MRANDDVRNSRMQRPADRDPSPRASHLFAVRPSAETEPRVAHLPRDEDDRAVDTVREGAIARWREATRSGASYAR